MEYSNKELKEACLDSISQRLRDNIGDKSSFEEITKQLVARENRKLETRSYDIVCLAVLLIASITSFYILSKDFSVLSNSMMNENPQIIPDAIILVIIILLIAGCWIKALDLHRYRNTPKVSVSKIESVKTTRNGLLKLIDGFRNGNSKDGIMLLDHLNNNLAFKSTLNRNEITLSMVMAICEMGNANESYKMAQLAKRTLSENEYFVALRTAEAKGSLRAAKELATLIGKNQESSKTGWLLAGLALGIIVS